MIDRHQAGNLIWEYMKRHNLNLSQTATLIDIPYPTLSTIIRGSHVPQFRTCAKIEKFLVLEQYNELLNSDISETSKNTVKELASLAGLLDK
jgi:transcriptional regulator with XRE-family HTH domain